MLLFELPNFLKNIASAEKISFFITSQGGISMKKVYGKPEISKINLVAEEAVLFSCKIIGMSGPQQLDHHCTFSTGEFCQTQGT